MQPEPQNSQQALSQLQQQQGLQRSATDILKGQQQNYGVQAAGDTVQGLRSAITNTTRLLNNVAPSVMGRTASSLVTNAQAQRQIANEQQPISQTLGEQTGGLNTAISDYDRASRQATEGANLELGDQQNKLSYLQNIYNNLFAREQAAEDTRRFNEQLALSKSKAVSGGGNYFDDPFTNTDTGNRTSTDPQKQDAFNEVQERIKGDANSIISDYLATLKSANYGNPRDKYKIEVYKRYRPDIVAEAEKRGMSVTPVTGLLNKVTSLAGAVGR